MHVAGDVLAGVTLAALGIPEVLGYAKIAGMPVVTGLYTLLLPMAVFAVLGSSRHLVVAADSATAAILSAALAGLAIAGSTAVRPVGWAGGLAGWWRCYCWPGWPGSGSWRSSCPGRCLVGFLTGVGIQVAAGQLPDMLGVSPTGSGTVSRLRDTARALPQAQRETVAISVAVILVVVVARRDEPPRPLEH